MAKFLSFETNIIYIKRLARNALSDSNDAVLDKMTFAIITWRQSVEREIWFTFLESLICHAAPYTILPHNCDVVATTRSHIQYTLMFD